MAYWQINHGSNPMRSISSQPASLHDLMHVLLMSRGVDPGSLNQTQPPGRPHAPMSRAGRQAPVRVHGGQSTPQSRSIGDAWHSANLPRDWAARTGSDPAAIAWATSED